MIDRLVEVLAIIGVGTILSMIGITIAVMVTSREMDR